MGVKIRENRGKLYLDINWNGRRRWESLYLTVSTDKQQNREIMRLAEICRSRRESQLAAIPNSRIIGGLARNGE
jgi:hypothetical protein